MMDMCISKDLTKIYLVTNCYGDPNKVYIGKTKNTRYNNHKKILGNDIIYIEIDNISSLNHEDWKPLECFWIEYFRQLGFDIQNKNKGGGGREFTTEETRNKISKSHTGKKHSKEVKEKMSKPKSQETRDKMKLAKQNISQETRDKIGLAHKGRKLSQESKNKISRSKQNISEVTRLRISLSSKGKILSQETKDKISRSKQNISQKTKDKISLYRQNLPQEVRDKISLANKGKNHTDKTKDKISQATSKPILQYDLEGNFIKEWPSATEATKVLLINNINSVCNGKLKTAGKFKWKYKYGF